MQNISEVLKGFLSTLSHCFLILSGQLKSLSSESALKSRKENLDPMSLMVAGLLQEIERVSVDNGPTLSLVEDLVSVLRKHDVQKKNAE